MQAVLLSSPAPISQSIELVGAFLRQDPAASPRADEEARDPAVSRGLHRTEFERDFIFDELDIRDALSFATISLAQASACPCLLRPNPCSARAGPQFGRNAVPPFHDKFIVTRLSIDLVAQDQLLRHLPDLKTIVRRFAGET